MQTEDERKRGAEDGRSGGGSRDELPPASLGLLFIAAAVALALLLLVVGVVAYFALR